MAGVIDKVKRKNKNDPKRDWTASGSFINKPATGWLHPDEQLRSDCGIIFGIMYVGCMEIKESMKSLDFETRTAVAKESISRVCEAAKLKTEAKRHKRNAKVSRLLGDKPNMVFAGSNVNLTITTEKLTLVIWSTGEIIGNHEMPGISFASGGDPDTMDFVAYVAKDEMFGRACHVLECGNGLAQDVITTIGQAFELRYKMYLANKPTVMSLPDREIHNGDTWGSDLSDRDYYNDRLGAQPPDVVPSYADSKPQTPASAPVLTEQHRARESAGISIADEVKCVDVYDNPLKESELGSEPVRSGSNLQGSTAPSESTTDAGSFAQEGSSAANSSAGVDLLSSAVPVLEQHLARCSVQSTVEQSHSVPSVASLDSDQSSSRPVSSSCSNDGSWSQSISQLSSPIQQPPSTGTLLPYHEPWFHGKISRQRVEQLLKSDGDFLVRESTNSPGQFVLSGRHSGKIKHLLLVDPEGVVRTKDRTFESISHLIHHHMSGRIPISSSDSELRLINPIAKTAA